MKRARRKKKMSIGKVFLTTLLISGVAGALFLLCVSKLYSNDVLVKNSRNPEDLLVKYMNYIPEGKYVEMYKLLSADSLENISQKDFVKRNSAIYEGIQIQNLIIHVKAFNTDRKSVEYSASFDTVAGNISFDNEMQFVKAGNEYKIIWDDSLIFPGLQSTDKVRVTTIPAVRGQILDRNGKILAGEGIASSVGIIPGKLKNKKKAVKKIAKLLGMKKKEIEKMLSATWVKEDLLVPIKTIPKAKSSDLYMADIEQEVVEEHKRQDKLLQISGVVISDVKIREYPLKEAAAHLVGYVQNVTAQDLEEHSKEGYTQNSVIGRTGMESLFEKELKGKDGCRIYIIDSSGKEKEELARRLKEDGINVRLTIDAELQSELYKNFKEDKSCSVSINPYTGEVLALVSTPSYDNNEFIMGMTEKRWKFLSEDEAQPLYNRFRQVWCPGSVFKPIIAAIGLQSKAIDPMEDYGNVGLSWQKDKSWGTYYITTLHAYSPVIMKNALIYSDNIYFAKAALKIGEEQMEESLSKLGFNEELPFEIKMSKSQYSNTKHIESEIQLADSGYGQGQILVNPLHLACIYSAFCNYGDVIKPRLVYKKNKRKEYWIENAFTKGVTEQVLDGVKDVVNNPHGTGYAAHSSDVLLAGKTGTAEIKTSKEDTSGTELGWFAVFTVEKDVKNPILIVSMVEDVKGRGGSGYVVRKDKEVLERWR